MSGNEHERWSEDIAAYMLGALEPAEAAELERHAGDCERCRSEMRWLTAAVEVLPEAVERYEPPPELRRRLLAEVEEDARAAGGKAEAKERAAPRRARSWLGGLGSGSASRGRLAWIAALALIVVAVGGYAIGTGGGEGGGSVTTFVSGQAEVVREGGSGEIHLTAVGDLPPNRVLEAWVRRDGEVEPVKALFVPDSEGNATTNLGDMEGVDLVMVTTEPAGGSKTPTGSPIAEVPVS